MPRGWYDVFAWFYDASVERIYAELRTQAFARLAPGLGELAVDLACGTGQNFGPLRAQLGEGVRIVGADLSHGMLKRSRARVSRLGMRGVYPLHCDARALPFRHADYVVCTLGLTAIPDWEAVLRTAFGLLRPGGQFLIMDVHAKRRVPQTWWVERIARADLARRTWEPLEAIATEFEIRTLPGSPHVHGGRPFVATGFRGVDGAG